MVRKYLYEHQKKKRKFKIHTGSVFEMAFKITETPLKGQKKNLQTMPCGYSKLVSQGA